MLFALPLAVPARAAAHTSSSRVEQLSSVLPAPVTSPWRLVEKRAAKSRSALATPGRQNSAMMAATETAAALPQDAPMRGTLAHRRVSRHHPDRVVWARAMR